MSQGFISLEGTEGSGKSTQLQRLAEHLRSEGYSVVTLREPGGTAIGEEIRHTLQHSHRNQAMTPEAELLLINASRAQLVREIIRPALAQGQLVLCDRFYDSTIAYQGYGRGLDLAQVRKVIDLAVGDTRPGLTLLLRVPLSVGESRRLQRQAAGAVRDRMEEADRDFFRQVEEGFDAVGASEPERVRLVDATASIEAVEASIWGHVSRWLQHRQVP